MAGRAAAPLAKMPQLIERQVVAEQVQQRVQQRRAVARAQHEAIAIPPARIARIVAQEAAPEHVRHRRRAERQARMPGVRLLDRVDRQEPQRVDAELVELFRRHARLPSPPFYAHNHPHGDGAATLRAIDLARLHQSQNDHHGRAGPPRARGGRGRGDVEPDDLREGDRRHRRLRRADRGDPRAPSPSCRRGSCTSGWSSKTSRTSPTSCATTYDRTRGVATATSASRSRPRSRTTPTPPCRRRATCGRRSRVPT